MLLNVTTLHQQRHQDIQPHTIVNVASQLTVTCKWTIITLSLKKKFPPLYSL